MRFFLYVYCIATVGLIVPVFAENATLPEEPAAAAEAALPAPAPVADLPPSRVGRVSLASGNVDLRNPGGAGWADAEVNEPVFAGQALRTDSRSRAEVQIGANTVDLSGDTEVELASLSNHYVQIAVSRGRLAVRLHELGNEDVVEVDFAQGGIWLLAPGLYDVDAGSGDQLSKVTVFEGQAQFVGGSGAAHLQSDQMLVMTSDAPAITEAMAPDNFVEWCRERDYDETRLAALYYITRDMTGFADLDAAGIWRVNPDYGPVWFPTGSEEWAPYRFGHWRWIPPWGWTWIDDQPWGFAPSHYGRWALINEHWAWVPGNFVDRPLYAPGVVAFLGTPGVGLSSEDGATVAWFPLAPGEVYWPSYTRDVDYVWSLNIGQVGDVTTIGLRADGEPPLENFSEDFANRQFATVVPRSIFTNGHPVAPARVTLPEKRLLDAPVLMASPQIAPAAPVQRVARAAPNPPATRTAVNQPQKRRAKPILSASNQPHGRAQSIVIRGAHLHVPSYAGQPRGRQTIMLRVAHSRGASGKRG
ncbi:MAG: DUF6600 domain-containing protein [Stellaceae bacterium]